MANFYNGDFIDSTRRLINSCRTSKPSEEYYLAFGNAKQEVYSATDWEKLYHSFRVKPNKPL